MRANTRPSITVIELAIVVCIAVILLSATAAPVLQCRSMASAMEFDYSWGPLQGCMIEVDGRWVPLQNYRVGEL